MKIYIIWTLLIALLPIPASAQNPVMAGKVKSGGIVFDFLRDKMNGKTTLTVEMNQASPPVWSRTEADFVNVGGNILDSWHLLDARAKGNDIALLLSTESDYRLLWVKATKANGVWTTDFEQELYGATLPQRHPGKMALNGTDSVVVADDKGQATFTRNGVGDVLKDGVFFHKSHPSQTLDKP